MIVGDGEVEGGAIAAMLLLLLLEVSFVLSNGGLFGLVTVSIMLSASSPLLVVVGCFAGDRAASCLRVVGDFVPRRVGLVLVLVGDSAAVLPAKPSPMDILTVSFPVDSTLTLDMVA